MAYAIVVLEVQYRVGRQTITVDKLAAPAVKGHSGDVVRSLTEQLSPPVTRYCRCQVVGEVVEQFKDKKVTLSRRQGRKHGTVVIAATDRVKMKRLASDLDWGFEAWLKKVKAASRMGATALVNAGCEEIRQPAVVAGNIIIDNAEPNFAGKKCWFRSGLHHFRPLVDGIVRSP
jgi:hypothetical protein